MSDKLSKIIIRKVRNKNEFCVKLGGKELHRFNIKEDALNFKREFEGKNSTLNEERPSGSLGTSFRATSFCGAQKEEEKKKSKLVQYP